MKNYKFLKFLGSTLMTLIILVMSLSPAIASDSLDSQINNSITYKE